MGKRHTLGILVVLASLGGLGTGFQEQPAEDTKKEKIEKLLDLTMHRATCRMLLGEYLTLTLKDSEAAPREFAMLFAMRADTKEVMEASRRICDEGLTEEEVDTLIAFLESPLGTKIRGGRPRLTMQLLGAWQRWAEDRAQEARSRLAKKPIATKSPTFSEPEKDAIKGLRTMVRAQAVFREGDKDNDGILAFAPNLSRLKRSGLIDDDLAEGARGAYSFTLVGGKYNWQCVAMPKQVDSDLHTFMVYTDGEVRWAPPGQIPGPVGAVVPRVSGEKDF